MAKRSLTIDEIQNLLFDEENCEIEDINNLNVKIIMIVTLNMIMQKYQLKIKIVTVKIVTMTSQWLMSNP